MSCVIKYKGKKYSEEQFKEYFINNKQEFATSIAKNKDVMDSFKRKMEGIDFVFSQSPELASIGSKAQYLQYLSTIFKTSKVKDIVYHGGNTGIDKFDKNQLGKSTGTESAKLGFFFTDNIEVANSYAKYTILEEIGELKELVIQWENTIKEAENNYKDKRDASKSLYNKSNSLLEKIKELIKKLLGYDFIKNNDLYKNALEEEYKAYEKFNSVRSIHRPITSRKGEDFFKNYKSIIINDPNKAIYTVLLNIENPKIDDFAKNPNDSGNWYLDSIKRIKENKHDSAILTNVVDAGVRSHFYTELFDESTKSWEVYVKPGITYNDFYKGTDYTVFEPEQIHILGSKQDIEGFKEFVNNTSEDYSDTAFNIC